MLTRAPLLAAFSPSAGEEEKKCLRKESSVELWRVGSAACPAPFWKEGVGRGILD